MFYDRLAEIAGEYLKKGKSVYIEGRLKTRKWTDKEGVDKYTTEIVAQEMTMLGSREGGGDETGSAAPSGAPTALNTPAPAAKPAAPAPPGQTYWGDDDIPL